MATSDPGQRHERSEREKDREQTSDGEESRAERNSDASRGGG